MSEQKPQQTEQKVSTASSTTKKPWSQEEKDLLTSGLVKYPIGTRDRYNLIAAFVGTRSTKEVIAQTNLAKTATAQGFYYFSLPSLHPPFPLPFLLPSSLII